jgi:DNA-binding NtrC family response regulator
VRELKNLIERLVILGTTDLIEPEHLPLGLATPVNGFPFASTQGQAPLAEVERAYIFHVLKSVDGNKTRAAEILGITRQTLRKKLPELSADEN